MSKILPKPMQSQSSQNIKSNQSRNPNPENDLIFATFFGDVRDQALSEELVVGKPLMSADVGEDNSLSDQTSVEMMAILASFQGGRGLGPKTATLQSDILSDGLAQEQATALFNSENADAVAFATSVALSQERQSGKTAMPRSGMAELANMVFEGEVSLNAKTGGATLAAVSKTFSPLDGDSLLGQNTDSIELSGLQKMRQNSDKVGENSAFDMENSLTKNMTSDMAKLRALRAANLEHQNADIDKEAAKADLSEIKGKLEKDGLNVAVLKQKMVSAANPPLTTTVAPVGEGGRLANDVTRLAAASSTAIDNALAITGTAANGSSTGQSGGQNSQQGSGQASSQFGGGLLANLNNLQILDTAKDNWNQILLQRVRQGLSGGKDQLDFQLNPRNLGKMRIRLVIQNDRTNVHIQTETSAAASLLGESEARLSQMLESSGLRLGNLNSGQFGGSGGAGSEQHTNQQGENNTGLRNRADRSQHDGEVVAETAAVGSDNLINIQA